MLLQKKTSSNALPNGKRIGMARGGEYTEEEHSVMESVLR